MPDSTVIGGEEVGVASTGAYIKLVPNASGELNVGVLAGERDRGTSNAHSQSNPEWTQYQFNPRAASTGSTLGAAGSVGTTEVLIGGGVPMTFGGWIPESDSAAGSILLRNATATGTSQAARSLNASVVQAGAKFTNGLCVVGTATGIAGTILARPTGANS